jgi:hypothetical protein
VCDHPSMRGWLAATVIVASCSGSSGPAITSSNVSCRDAIGALPAPPPEMEVVLRVVALPTAKAYSYALQTSRTGETQSVARLFAKTGLVVNGASRAELSVPPEARGQLEIGWGSPGHPAQRIVVPPCGDAGEWLAWAGGYFVPEVGCVPLDVTVGGTTRQVSIGVGAPCPGQQPPPEPSES